jgi:hypothetical protein
MDPYITFNQTFDPGLPPLPEFDDIDASSLLNFEPPRINVNRTNSIPVPSMENWSPSGPTYLHPTLHPIQTDVHVQPSPALSNTSQLSDSSNFLSPRTLDLATPSPTTSQGTSYPAILSSPESPVRQLDSLSPAFGISVGGLLWK